MTDLQTALNILENSGVLLYPTETLIGMGVRISDLNAVKKVYELKGRDFDKPLSILVSDLNMAMSYAHLTENVLQLASIVWPGPVTLVLPKKDTVLDSVVSGGAFVGVRCSPIQELKNLIISLQEPITTTSVNRSGEPAALTMAQTLWLGDRVWRWDFPVRNEGTGSVGSTIIKIENNRVTYLREGDFPISQLNQILLELNFKISKTN